ncbi:PEGA domain-containing protein [Bdellovibrionota bacterium FG-2]
MLVFLCRVLPYSNANSGKTQNLIANFCRSLFTLLVCGTVLAADPSIKKILFIAPVEVSKGVVEGEILTLLTNAVREAYQNSGKYILVSMDDANIRAQVSKYNQACSSVEECIVKEAEKKAADLYLRTAVICPENQDCNLTMILKDHNQNVVVRTESLTTPKRDAISLIEKVKNLSLTMLTDKVSAVGSGRMRTVTIRSNPSGAELFIDNDSVGKTPWTGEIAIGQHPMSISPTVRKFAPIAETLEVFPGKGAIEIDRNLVTNFATVLLEIIPPQANLVLDGKEFSKKELRIPLQEQRTLQVSFKGYENSSFKLGPYEEPRNYPEKLELQALPGDLLLITNPPGVAVIIDDLPEQKTDGKGHLRLRPERGKHRFALKKDGYQTTIEEIVIEPGETIARTYTLAPGNRDVSVSIKSNPSGADVEIDGKLVSSTPFDRKMQPGNYKIVLTKDGYNSETETISVEPERNFAKHFTLRTPSPPEPFTPPMKPFPAMLFGLFAGIGGSAYNDTSVSFSSPAESATITVDTASSSNAFLGFWSQLRIWKYLGIRGAYSKQWGLFSRNSAGGTIPHISVSSGGTTFHGYVLKSSEGGSLWMAGPALMFQTSDTWEFFIHPYFAQSKASFSFSGEDVRGTLILDASPLSNQDYSSPPWTNNGGGIELGFQGLLPEKNIRMPVGLGLALGFRSFGRSDVFAGQSSIYFNLSCMMGWL